MKKHKCRVCKAEYVKFNSTQVVCSVGCAVEYGRKQEAKKAKEKRKRFNAETRSMKEKVKTRTQWLSEAQKELNRYIRVRDSNKPCISCQRYHQGKYDAGHYRTVKAASHLRFNLLNIHAQCVPCNRHLSANLVEYRINLVKKIGVDRVEAIESNNDVRKFDVEYAKRVKDIFRRRSRLYEKLFRNSK